MAGIHNRLYIFGSHTQSTVLYKKVSFFIMLCTEPERVQNVNFKKKKKEKDPNSDNVFSTRSGRYKNWG